MPTPFQQQPRESAAAYEAFREYLNAGVKRSLASTARQLGKSSSSLERWSTRWNWQARIRAYTEHLREKENLAAEALATARGMDMASRQLEQKEEEWRLRCDAIELARAAIERWKADPRRCGSLQGIARLLELASKLGRLSTDLPAESNETAVQMQGTLDFEWEAALRKMYGPANPAGLIDITPPALPDAKPY